MHAQVVRAGGVRAGLQRWRERVVPGDHAWLPSSGCARRRDEIGHRQIGRRSSGSRNRSATIACFRAAVADQRRELRGNSSCATIATVAPLSST